MIESTDDEALNAVNIAEEKVFYKKYGHLKV